MKNDWDVEAAISTYNVDGWGTGYFSVNAAGNAEVRPLQEKGGAIDILEVVNEARNRGLGFPLVIRFQDLLRHRVESVNCAFQRAIEEFGYKNHYRGVFPIKVNQLREVIEEIVDAGQEFHFGLEAGSKPELVAALAMHKDPESLIICNGYKDRAFIRIALLGRKLGKKVVVDPKGKDFSKYAGASIITPNRREASAASQLEESDEALIDTVGRRLVDDLDLEALLITRSEEGMSLFVRGQSEVHLQARTKEIYDVTGAGDTVVAALAVSLAATFNYADAAAIANAAAGIAVQHIGTSTVSIDELMTAGRFEPPNHT
jgi:hypothetical protein